MLWKYASPACAQKGCNRGFAKTEQSSGGRWSAWHYHNSNYFIMWVVRGISSCMAWSHLDNIILRYFIMWSVTKWPLWVWLLVRVFFLLLPISLFSLSNGWQDLMVSFWRFQEVPGCWKKEEVPLHLLSSLTSPIFFLSSDKVREPLLSSLSATCHCDPHFPKDYCHWPLPFG